jgi:membrane associated rhomboid family serine protease
MNSQLKYTDGIWFYPFMLTLAIWFVKVLEVRYNLYFTEYGILPRTFSGLRGVLLSPFIHADLKHLWANTAPFFVTSAMLYYFYRNIFWKLLLYGVLFSGLFTWLIARPSYHIGVSGLLYANVSFLFFAGVFSKNYRLMAVSLLIIFLYGGMIWYVFPMETGVSWEGHLSGLLIGFILAFYYRNQVLAKEKKYTWEQEHYNPTQDEFMQSFDENGNFIDPPKEPEFEEEPELLGAEQEQVKIIYTIKPKKKD